MKEISLYEETLNTHIGQELKKESYEYLNWEQNRWEEYCLEGNVTTDTLSTQDPGKVEK